MKWKIPNGISKWIVAYRDALSFRTNHYYVSYLSEATAVAAGFGIGSKDLWTLQVSAPRHIEFPRSLPEVVKAWNIPMHNWIKKCKFNNLHDLFYHHCHKVRYRL